MGCTVYLSVDEVCLLAISSFSQLVYLYLVLCHSQWLHKRIHCQHRTVGHPYSQSVSLIKTRCFTLECVWVDYTTCLLVKCRLGMSNHIKMWAWLQGWLHTMCWLCSNPRLYQHDPQAFSIPGSEPLQCFTNSYCLSGEDFETKTQNDQWKFGKMHKLKHYHCKSALSISK